MQFPTIYLGDCTRYKRYISYTNIDSQLLLRIAQSTHFVHPNIWTNELFISVRLIRINSHIGLICRPR